MIVLEAIGAFVILALLSVGIASVMHWLIDRDDDDTHGGDMVHS